MRQCQVIYVTTTFGCPKRIVADKGAAFTSEGFSQYWTENWLHHMMITTGMPRGNGQVERLNAVIAFVVAKLSVQDPGRWFKNVS